MRRYFLKRTMQQVVGEEAEEARRLIFADDLSGKAILTEDSVYYEGDPGKDTIYRIGAVTKPGLEDNTRG